MKMQEEKEVDGVRYQMNHYSASKGIRLLAKLLRVAGKPVSLVMAGGVDAEVKPEVIASAVEALAFSMEPKDFEDLCKELIEGTFIYDEGKMRSIVFEKDFSGRLGHLFKVLFQILKFQFQDFLGEVAAAVPGLATKETKAHKLQAM